MKGTTPRPLENIADDMLDWVRILPEPESRMLRQAMYTVEDLKTTQAVAELMTVACKAAGLPAPQASTVLRRPRTVRS